MPPQSGMWLLRIGPNIVHFELFTNFIQILIIRTNKRSFVQPNSSLNGQGVFSWGANQLILGVRWGMGSTGQEMYRKTNFYDIHK